MFHISVLDREDSSLAHFNQAIMGIDSRFQSNIVRGVERWFISSNWQKKKCTICSHWMKFYFYWKLNINKCYVKTFVSLFSLLIKHNEKYNCNHIYRKYLLCIRTAKICGIWPPNESSFPVYCYSATTKENWRRAAAMDGIIWF
jgi:hypothetical protein